MHEKFLGAGSFEGKEISAYCPPFHSSNPWRFRFAITDHADCAYLTHIPWIYSSEFWGDACIEFAMMLAMQTFSTVTSEHA
jgi:hypothetical protein